METNVENRKANHGKAVEVARCILNITQEALADEVGTSQKEISNWEKKRELSDEVLDKIAKAMKMPVEFFKNFDADKMIKSYYMHDNENNFAITDSDNSNENVVQQGEQENTYNTYYPLEKVSELYERIVDLSDKLAVSQTRYDELLKTIYTLNEEIKKLNN